jgi:hypothetical protein
MNDRIEEILRNPSVLKTAEGDGYTDAKPSRRLARSAALSWMWRCAST